MVSKAQGLKGSLGSGSPPVDCRLVRVGVQQGLGGIYKEQRAESHRHSPKGAYGTLRGVVLVGDLNCVT